MELNDITDNSEKKNLNINLFLVISSINLLFKNVYYLINFFFQFVSYLACISNIQEAYNIINIKKNIPN